MYGSYGSYSSMSIGALPMNISTSVTSRDESCAYPSWPRRSSLSSTSTAYEPRASSYLSDDDLFLYDEPSGSGSDSDDGRSVSSSSSAGSASPPTLGLVLASPVRQAPTEAEILETQRQRLNMRKDLIRMVQQEREVRKQASKQRRAAGKKSSSSSKTRGYTMEAISEADE